jgi:hypothetical protein
VTNASAPLLLSFATPTLVVEVVLSHFAAGAIGALQWSDVAMSGGDAFDTPVGSQMLT